MDIDTQLVCEEAQDVFDGRRAVKTDAGRLEQVLFPLSPNDELPQTIKAMLSLDYSSSSDTSDVEESVQKVTKFLVEEGPPKKK